MRYRVLELRGPRSKQLSVQRQPILTLTTEVSAQSVVVRNSFWVCWFFLIFKKKVFEIFSFKIKCFLVLLLHKSVCFNFLKNFESVNLESLKMASASDLFCCERLQPELRRAEKDPVIYLDSRVLPNLLSMEKLYIPKCDYFSDVQFDIKPYMRKVVATWMLEVSVTENFSKSDRLLFRLSFFIFPKLPQRKFAVLKRFSGTSASWECVRNFAPQLLRFANGPADKVLFTL